MSGDELTYGLASDDDGVRHIVLDSDDQDCAGWVLEADLEGGGTWHDEFERGRAYGFSPHVNLIGFGRPIRENAWKAICDWDTVNAIIRRPDGKITRIIGRD